MSPRDKGKNANTYDAKALLFFFQDIFNKESAKICYSTIKKQSTAENLKKQLKIQLPNQNILDLVNEVNIENCGVAAACKFAATNIDVWRFQALLTMLDRKKMKKYIGKPSIIVKLPSGDLFNTKLIA